MRLKNTIKRRMPGPLKLKNMIVQQMLGFLRLKNTDKR